MVGNSIEVDVMKERFLAKTKRVGECLMWVGAMKDDRYGAFRLDGRIERAHRASWTLHYGGIPDGMNVCHKCDVPLCVNPAHLFIGTASDNMKDAVKKGRLKRRGNHSPRRILSEDDVKRIRKLRKAGRTGVSLAKQYGVSPSTIAAANTGRNWSHI